MLQTSLPPSISSRYHFSRLLKLTLDLDLNLTLEFLHKSYPFTQVNKSKGEEQI